MLTSANAILVLIDVQEKLTRVMFEQETLVENLTKLIQGIQILGMPMIWMEQYPQGLGPTIPALRDLLGTLKPIEKRCFSCCDSPDFAQALASSGRRHIILCGIEAHVCVYQTARDLRATGYETELVADAVSSRTQRNRDIGIERMCALGVAVSSVEMVLFELLREAQGDAFKAISRLVR